MGRIDFSEWVLDVDGARLDDEGYYRCEACDVVLEATGRRDSKRNVPAAFFACPDCGEAYSIAGVDSRPRPSLGPFNLDL